MYTALLVANFVWRTYGTPWIEMAAKGNLGQMSLHASRALSQTNFGSAHHQEEIKLDGMTQYSKVLKALAPQLSDPRRPGVEELIVPVMMLLIHAASSYFRATRRRYQRRADMPITVIPGRPQRLHITRQRFDPAATTVGLITRQRSLLEQDHWRTVPWALNSSAQSAQSRLVNILILVPGFLEDDTRLDREFDFELF
ncbi:hypothetical protein MMC22_003461 [Lobaria immixta]|nr:hypothetical protein [Lobaria immixta]